MTNTEASTEAKAVVVAEQGAQGAPKAASSTRKGHSTLLVDDIGIGLAAFGVLSPLLAAFIRVGSELALILNSARLLPSASRAA